MREAVAASEQRVKQLEQAMEMDRGLLAAQGRHLREVEAFHRQVAAQVGQQAIIANAVPRSMAVQLSSTASDDHFRIGCAGPLDMRSMRSMPPDAPMPIDQLRSVTLRMLRVRAVQDAMRTRIDAKVHFADSVVGYGMTQQAIDGMTAEEIAERIAPELVRMLAQAIKGARGSRARY